ncbi:uncharacterized protein C8Q71DRAFT_396546 [Rhodofomes roseus]|uniref:Secreted protein n=1 Tax=Rhodofomes roseus TaxID=34475 RepID=A0ABQ8JZC2_9APHY|nr:uncharacterized protein C8Q71DRAFT_396546 [Rhodofomes roseus]KAH9829660.1 hypothetical protein C8Q71DRAFT_396546 [Rhodofomes roseus]
MTIGRCQAGAGALATVAMCVVHSLGGGGGAGRGERDTQAVAASDDLEYIWGKRDAWARTPPASDSHAPDALMGGGVRRRLSAIPVDVDSIYGSLVAAQWQPRLPCLPSPSGPCGIHDVRSEHSQHPAISGQLRPSPPCSAHHAPSTSHPRAPER